MSNWTIKAPNDQYSGISGSLLFTDGQAVTDRADLADWFARNGYTVTKGGTITENTTPMSVADPGHGLGAPSRDAAVVGKAAEGPLSDAFLPPVGAGQGNDPHGDQVASPGLHGVPPAPVVPGEVSRVAEEQEAKESQAAEAVLIQNEEVSVAALDEPDWLGDENEARPVGPLEVSDPGSEGQEGDAAAPERPAENASKDAWVSFAVASGMDPDEAASHTRAGLIQQFPEEG